MDPRKILGVENNASPEEIQRAYRDKVKKHHPDMGGDTWAFQQVQEAYEALTNPNSAAAKPNPQSNNTQPAQSQNQHRSHRQSARTGARSKANDSAENRERHWWQLFVGELPLQKETMLFILVNCMDIFLTHKLLQAGAVEANPIANYFFKLWNFNGMIAFKLSIVAVVCVIAQIIALKRFRTAQALLIVGIILVGAVVIYSIRLYMLHFWF